MYRPHHVDRVRRAVGEVPCRTFSTPVIVERITREESKSILKSMDTCTYKVIKTKKGLVCREQHSYKQEFNFIIKFLELLPSKVILGDI